MTNRPTNDLDYIALPEVKSFIDWLCELLADEAQENFTHHYLKESKGRSTKQKEWSCSSLLNAFEKYEWPFSYYDCYKEECVKGKSYQDSETALNSLQELLLRAVDSQDNDLCSRACEMILKWGGVLGSDKKGNKKKINELGNCLAAYLQSICDYFNGGGELSDVYQVSVRGNTMPILMTAGFTKIYSLLCKDFVIYDGRVGAALGLLVRLFLERNNYEILPESLAFYYGNAKNPNVNRNPSSGQYRFKALSTSYAVHIRCNLKANWVIKNIGWANGGGFSRQSNPLRAFEAALFMVGYRI